MTEFLKRLFKKITWPTRARRTWKKIDESILSFDEILRLKSILSWIEEHGTKKDTDTDLDIESRITLRLYNLKENLIMALFLNGFLTVKVKEFTEKDGWQEYFELR